MSPSKDEVAAILAALRHIESQKQQAPAMDRWTLAARLDHEPDPWQPPTGEAYCKLHA